MTRKATNTTKPNQSSRWQLLLRHPLLLKALTWLSSLSIMASASVSWAEIKPIEIISPAVDAGKVLTIESPTETTYAALTDSDLASLNTHKKLHNDLFGANNLTVAVKKNNSRRTYRAQPGILNNAASKSAQQLVSNLTSNVRPQGKMHPAVSSPMPNIQRVSYRAEPAVAPLPMATNTKARPLAREQSVKPQVQLEKPQALASLNVPGAMPLYVAPPQTNVIPDVSRIPTVSTPRTLQVSPLPTVQVARVNTVSPTGLAISNYGVNSDFIYPLATPAPMTSPFGWRVHPITGNRRFHSGQDLGAPTGTPIVSVAKGRVVVAKWHGGYGKTVIIEHDGRLQTLYGHMSEIFVQEGQEIAQGTVIGQVGSTGNSTGPHLHFETKVPTAEGWMVVDPGQDLRYALSNLEQALRLARRP
jgi:murein DD-endopeptidase MepM/ murein hydrolase activator NlpD